MSDGAVEVSRATVRRVRSLAFHFYIMKNNQRHKTPKAKSQCKMIFVSTK